MQSLLRMGESEASLQILVHGNAGGPSLGGLESIGHHNVQRIVHLNLQRGGVGKWAGGGSGSGALQLHNGLTAVLLARHVVRALRAEDQRNVMALNRALEALHGNLHGGGHLLQSSGLNKDINASFRVVVLARHLPVALLGLHVVQRANAKNAVARNRDTEADVQRLLGESFVGREVVAMNELADSRGKRHGTIMRNGVAARALVLTNVLLLLERHRDVLALEHVGSRPLAVLKIVLSGLADHLHGAATGGLEAKLHLKGVALRRRGGSGVHVEDIFTGVLVLHFHLPAVRIRKTNGEEVLDGLLEVLEERCRGGRLLHDDN